MRARRSIEWMRKAGVAVATAAILVSGLSLVPASAQAQERLPTWPAFPKEVTGTPASFNGDARYGFTERHFSVAYCYLANDSDRSCTHQGVEEGSSPAVTITSTCSYALRPAGQTQYLQYCQVDFSDNRYRVFFETSDDFLGGSIVEIVAEVQRSPFGSGNEIGRQRRVADFDIRTVPEDWQNDPDGDGTGGGADDGDGTGTGGEVRDADSNTLSSADNSCSIATLDLAKCFQQIMSKLVASFLWIFVSILGSLLGVFGMLFNWVVLVTVFQYSTYFGNSEGLLLAWSVLRDLGNILLLFGFIFIGLQTILNVGHFSVGKALPRLLIFAILINFSLLVSSAIVDVSNVFSAVFYTEAGSVNCGGNEDTLSGGGTPGECTGDGIAGKIMAAAGLSSLFSGFQDFGTIWDARTDGFSMLIAYFGLLLLIIIMMIVFIAASIMLLIRAITLMFLLVLSPIGFAATAIPQFEEYSKMWWSKLLSQAFFAPAFLLMLFVGLKIMDGAKATFNASDASLVQAFAAGGTSSGGIFILFSLIIGFTIGSLIIASRIGAMGASFATSKASGLVLGGAGFIGRRTVGRYAAQREEKLRAAGKDTTPMGKLQLSALKAVSGSSMDVRTSGLVKKAASTAHLDIGSGPKGAGAHGWHGIHEKAEKERVEADKKIKQTADERAAAEEAQAEIDELERSKREDLSGARQAVNDKVADIARLRAEGADQALITAEQRRLDELTREYNTLENELRSSVPIERDVLGADGKPTGEKKLDFMTVNDRIKELKGRKKQWNAIGESEKTERMIQGYEESAANPFMAVTAGPHADHEAIARIRKDRNMDATTKAFKELESALKSNTKAQKENAKEQHEHAGDGDGDGAHPH